MLGGNKSAHEGGGELKFLDGRARTDGGQPFMGGPHIYHPLLASPDNEQCPWGMYSTGVKKTFKSFLGDFVGFRVGLTTVILL